MGTKTLRFGGDYNPEQWPRETWDDDVRLMREAGVDLVSIGIWNWVFIEPAPGRFDFAMLDDLIDLLHRNGIAIDLGTPTAAPPAWFWRANPDALPVTRDGVRLGYGGRGMASPSSAAYRAAVTRVVEALATRYGAHPAIVMWHVHNEYGAPVSESYDDESVAAFRRWLSTRYDTVEALNEAWGTAFWGQRYGDWEEIDAPRTAATVVNPAQRLDFARFTSDALLACFRLERDIIRRHAPGIPVTTNLMASSCPSVDYWSWAREVDVVSNDHYLTAERDDNHVLLALDADLTRSLAGGAPWVLMEHSTSAVNWQPRNIAKRAGEAARNSLAHVARGADDVLFFQIRASRHGAEKFHSALIPHAGPDSRIWRESVELGATLDRLDGVSGTRTAASVAILWDWASFWALDLEWRPSVDVRHRERIEAHYRALWDENVTVDFRHPGDDLTDYRVVLAPSLYLVDATSAANLERYVRGGGRLVVSYFSGIVDANDAVPPGPHPGALRDVLGLSIEEFLPLRTDESVVLDDGGTGDVWTDAIRLEGAEAVVRYVDGPAAGGPAITRHRLGDGTAWYLGTRQSATRLAAFLRDVLDSAGVARRPADGVEIVTRVGEGIAYTFHLNHTDRDVTVPVSADARLVDEDRPLGGVLLVPAGRVLVTVVGTGSTPGAAQTD